MKEPADFSLVLGGPLYQLWRRTRLAGDSLQFPNRRVITLALLAWLPLLLLSMAQGLAWGDRVTMPFLYDVDIHLRLLVALPLLILAEPVVHERMHLVVRQFVNRNLIPDPAEGRLEAAVASAMRLRNSMTAELLLLAFVYVVGVGVVWRTQVALDVTSWYGTHVDGRLSPSLAGWWMGCVSLPILQFLLLRWYFRLFIWARFLWQMSRIDLRLMPTHPDRCGGLGFLASVSHAFAPVLLAQGVMLCGMIAGRIFFLGEQLLSFKLDLIGLVLIMLLFVLGPLLVFAPKLAAAKRTGLREYGTLAKRYTDEFDHKWLRGGAPAGAPLIGSADIQSLADLGNSFEVIKDMRLAPFNLQTVLQLAVITLLPVLPLTLTMISLEELVDRLLKIVF